MKFIYCPKCSGFVPLQFEPRVCKCGQSGGKYKKDGLHAIIWGGAIPWGIDNKSFATAIKRRPLAGNGSRIEAFVIPHQCDTVEVIERGRK